jgi:hypothetical protein
VSMRRWEKEASMEKTSHAVQPPRDEGEVNLLTGTEVRGARPIGWPKRSGEGI